MTALRKAREIIGALMHLLHERCLGINQPAAPKHPMNFGSDCCRLQHMLKHGLDPNAVKHPVFKRQLVGIGHQGGVR
jgi:hypothetical protein